MERFPAEVRFRFPWRPYQQRVLDELEEHLGDERLHVIAPPGSGKTVLGLEVARRLDRPTLFLSPTLTIRDQWVARFRECFLPADHPSPNWISNHLDRPAFFTAATYQALHRLLAREDQPNRGRKRRTDPYHTLRRAGIRTLVVDEAHHLKRAWWKSLMQLEKALDRPVVVALTATPPYDVSALEWQRYRTLCGPVDAEINVPELVLQQNLCPHQDYIYLSLPNRKEVEPIERFQREMHLLLEGMTLEPDLIACVEAHPWVTEPLKHLPEIVRSADYFTALLVFLRRVGRWIPPETMTLLEVKPVELPRWSLKWMQLLLTGVVFNDPLAYEAIAPQVDRMRRRLSRLGAVRHRRVHCRTSAKIERSVTASVSKLESIAAIAAIESEALADRLRMVVLADYIYRGDLPTYIDDLKPLQRIGVVPIFERLRREYRWGIRLGVLTGSLVIVPETSLVDLKIIAVEMDISLADLHFEFLGHDPGYVILTISGPSGSRVVDLISRLFALGQINLLVGTQSLLGEGWDAPSLNALILATVVGSYVLSNQMRGRAVRVDASRPDKAANIWHLVCLPPGPLQPGSDMRALERRFQAFVGVSFREPRILSGLDRMGLGARSFTAPEIEAVNRRMSIQAADRDGLRSQWQAALEAGGSEGRMVEEIRAPRAANRRAWVLQPANTAWLGEGAFLAGLTLLTLGRQAQIPALEGALAVGLAWGCAAGALALLPAAFKHLLGLCRFGPDGLALRRVGRAVLQSLVRLEVVKRGPGRLRLAVRRRQGGAWACRIEGGSRFDQAVFLDTLQEVLGPIGNPRYLLVPRRWGPGSTGDRVVPVPGPLGRNQAAARCFHRQWRKTVGAARLFATRTEAGKALLLKARVRAASAAVHQQVDRRARWIG